MIPERLLTDVEELRVQGHEISLIEIEGFVLVTFRMVSVPRGYSKASTRLLVKAPLSFPNGAPDMFWTDPDLTLPDGRSPQSADQIEDIRGEKWRRFSWHPQKWNPGTDGLGTYLEFINSRLRQGV